MEQIISLISHGIWSDGETMCVADSDNKKLYAYNHLHSGNASLKSLELINVHSGNELFFRAF